MNEAMILLRPGQMSTIEFVDHLTTIAFDIIAPALIAWLAYSFRKWLPQESQTHRELHDLMGVLAAFLRTQASAQTAAELREKPEPVSSAKAE